MRIALLSLVAFTLTGCSVYRSTDRDFFDANGRSGAPAATAAVHEFDARPDIPNGDVSAIFRQPAK